MIKVIHIVLLPVFFGVGAFADSPPQLDVADSHSVANKGKINLYRVQIQGLEFGRDQEALDAEILVTLDTQPGMVFGLRLHPDSPPVNKIMADTLREAYLNQTPVTLQHQVAPGKKHAKIHVIQLN